MSPRYKSNKRNRISAKGFTLPEMIISLGIIMAVSTVIVTSQSRYTESAALANVADNISLTLSQAQVYGVSVRQVAPGSGNFTSAYGMDFRRPSAGGSSDAYIFFADRNNDMVYGDGWSCPLDASSECIEKTSILYGNSISSLCVIYTDNTEDCGMGRISITFIRPDTQARLVFFNTAGNQVNLSNVKGAKINLSAAAPSTFTRQVEVYTTGYISVQ